MVTGLAYLFTSLTLALLLPYLKAGSGHLQIADGSVYQYPRNVSRFFLFMMLIYLAGVAVLFFITSRNGTYARNVIPYCVTASCLLSLLAISYLFFQRYRVLVNPKALTIITIFRTKNISFEQVFSIGSIQGRGLDLHIYDSNGIRLGRVDGSLQDFEFLLQDIERYACSPRVMLYRSSPGLIRREWQERMNDGHHALWSSSQGPTMLREQDGRISKILILGISLVLIASVVSWWFSRVM